MNTMLREMFGKNLDLFLVGGVIAILLILFAPIPPLLLDFSIITNFALRADDPAADLLRRAAGRVLHLSRRCC